MPYELERFPDEWDSFHAEVVDPRRLVSAIEADCLRHGLARLRPEDLVAFGRWLHGEEDPYVRRFLVSPPGERWTSVLLSAIDWDLGWSANMAAVLGCRAAYLQLSDGDVFSLHLFDGPAYVAGYASSTDYFDLPPRPAGDLGVDPEAVLAFCRAGTTIEEVREALAPPGRIDVDGRLAFLRTAALLELPPRAATSYREALESDGVTPLPEFADHVHLTYREVDQSEAEAEGDGESAEEGLESVAPSGPTLVVPDGGVVLPFRRK